MHEHPILVRHIQHLTDARYFAAMGVDYMSLVLDESRLSFDRWHAIRDWVAGVNLIAEFDESNEDLLAKVIIDVAPDGIVKQGRSELLVPPEMIIFQWIQEPNEFSVEGPDKWIYPYADTDSWQHIASKVAPEQLFLEADWNEIKLSELLSSGYTGGICFSGGKEDVLGMRDYSVMDELISKLRD